MTLCFFLKILGELSLYFCIANAVLSIALTGVESILPLFIVSLIAAVGHYIDEKHSKFRFFLRPLLLSVFFLGSGFAYYLAVGLPALYIALTIVGQRYYVDHDTQADLFRTGIAVIICFSIVFVLVLGLDHIVPFAMIFLIANIFMLRLLRQDAEIFNETRFRVMNILTVGATLLAAVIITSKPAMMILQKFYNFILTLLQPVLYLFVYGGYAFYWVLTWVIATLRSLFSGETVDQNQLLESGMNMLPEGLEQTVDVTNPDILRLIQGGLVAIGIFLVVLYFLGNRRGRNKRSEGSLKEVRSSVTNYRPEEKIFADHFPPREPRAAVRYYYRSFLRMCQSIGHEFPRHFTSKHIENTISYQFKKEHLQEMRETYIRARYSEQEITKEDVKHIKEQVKLLKSDVSELLGNFIDTHDSMADKLRNKYTINDSETKGKGPGEGPRYESNYRR